MKQGVIAIFDLSITSDSPAGSCVLQMLKGLCEEFQFVVFADRFDNPHPQHIQWVRVPLPQKPVFLRYMVFKWTAPWYYRRYVATQTKPQLIVATEGQFSNCDICYAHFCHQAYLEQQEVKAGFLRRQARLLTRRFNAKIEALALAQAHKVVVPSDGLRAEIEQTYGAIVSGKVTKISNPIEVNRFQCPSDFSVAQQRAALGLGETDLVLVFSALGDFDRKGLEPLLEAIAALNQTRLNQAAQPVVKLLVVGGSATEIQEYAQMRDRLGITQQVTFVGFQSDIRPYLWLADLFVLPSKYETFSLVTFQAAAAGLPLMTTQLYGVEELLQDGINGWLIERQVASIAQALNNALGQKPQLAQMGAAARQLVASFDQSFFIDRWKAVLTRSLPVSAPHSPGDRINPSLDEVKEHG
jgi:glycosyltransferase involved in cell wall biosynthesis